MEQLETGRVAATKDRFAGLSPSILNAQEKQSVVTLATKVLAAKFRAGRVLSSPEETRNFLRLRLAELKNEVFGCIFLNTRHRIITVSELFQGTIDGASVHPRVVVQKALELNSSALILAHFVPRNKMVLMRPVSLCAPEVSSDVFYRFLIGIRAHNERLGTS